MSTLPSHIQWLLAADGRERRHEMKNHCTGFPLSFRASKVHVKTKKKYENVLIVVISAAVKLDTLSKKKTIFLIFIHRLWNKRPTRCCFGLHRFNTMAYHHHVVLCVVIFILIHSFTVDVPAQQYSRQHLFIFLIHHQRTQATRSWDSSSSEV